MPECRVVFENRTPAFWKVSIVQIGAKFFYKNIDGTHAGEWQTSKQVDLPAGATDQFMSNDPSACVGALFAAMSVRQPGKPDQILTKSDSADPNECATQWVVCIQPSGMKEPKNIEEALGGTNVEISIRPLKDATKLR